MQDVLNMLNVGKEHATVVLVMGPPGCGKTGLMVDLIAAATEGSPFRRETADARKCASRMPACTPQQAKLMCHKAMLTFNVGFPAQTITAAMRTIDWLPRTEAQEARYTADAARAVAGHRLHIVEETQSLVQHLSMLFERLGSAVQQCGGTRARMLHDCAHVFSMDPLQAACREHGVRAVTAQGAVQLQHRRVVMPWAKIFECTGTPSQTLRYKVLIVHGNFRMEGLLYRLLRGVYATPR